MNTIKRYANVLEVMSIFFIIGFPLLMMLKWLQDKIPFTEKYTAWVTYTTKVTPTPLMLCLSEMPILHKVIGFCVDSIGAAIVIAGLYHFMLALHFFKQGKFFTPKVLGVFNKMSRLALWWVIYNPLKLSLLSIITTLHKTPGSRILSISLGSDDLINVVIFCFLVILTTILQEAQKLQHEQDFTV